jgi:hypothetical protein
MKTSTMKKALVLVTVSSAFALGCELIVDFDRTKIPVEGAAETGVPDVSAATPESGTPDTGAPVDGGQDATDAADAGDAGDADADA